MIAMNRINQKMLLPSETKPDESYVMILKFPSRNIQEAIRSLEMDEELRIAEDVVLLLSPCSSMDKVTLHFIDRDGEKYLVNAKEGESLLEVVINQNININGFGACEGTLACSTCHLIFEKAAFQQLGEISDDELDMLDLAYGLTDT
ncbi:hypothetical protein Chor_004374 [Crotalus horridus]